MKSLTSINVNSNDSVFFEFDDHDDFDACSTSYIHDPLFEHIDVKRVECFGPEDSILFGNTQNDPNNGNIIAREQVASIDFELKSETVFAIKPTELCC